MGTCSSKQILSVFDVVHEVVSLELREDNEVLLYKRLLDMLYHIERLDKNAQKELRAIIKVRLDEDKKENVEDK